MNPVPSIPVLTKFAPLHFLKKRWRTHRQKWTDFFNALAKFSPHVYKHTRRLVLALCAGLGYTLMGLLEPWPLKLLFDNVFGEEPLPHPMSAFLPGDSENKFQMLYILILSLIFISLFKGLFYYFQQLLTSRCGQQIAAAIRLDLYGHLQRLSFRFHDKKRTGDLLTRLTTDIKTLRELLVSLPLTTACEILFMTSMLIVMACMDWQLTLIAIAVFPALFLLVQKYRPPMKEAVRAQREREGQLTSIASEVLGAIKVVQGFQQEGSELSKFRAENKNTLKSGLKATRLEAKLKWASELCIALVSALILAVAGGKVLSGQLSPGDLLVFVFYLKNFNQPLRRLSKKTEVMARGTASAERILHLMKIEPEIEDNPRAITAARSRGEIHFEQISFEYKPGRPILKDIDLMIAPGEKIAIVGATGSGKSTLVSLLPRFYDPTRGKICIDGSDIRNWTLASLRNQISIVFQEPVLFASSIFENIAYGKPDAALDEILEAAKKAQIHAFIEELPEGYQTVLGERGATLSGGQRQCIAIARSLIKNAPIVILDEPTTGLDPLSAMLVMNALKELMRNRTVLMISHQADTLTGVDRIVHLHKGKILRQSATI